jgi:probable F420-dependent oxidoreductase
MEAAMAFTGVVMHGPLVQDHVDIAVEAERLGYRDAWVTEVQGPDAVTVLAAAASATNRIRLATGIVATYVRDPYLMAMTGAALQDHSQGRFVAGFGTSTPAIVTGWHGLPWGKPLRTTREYVDIFRRAASGARLKEDGIYKLRGATLRTPAPSPIPVYLGALNNGMLELAGEIADGVILNFPTVTYARDAIRAVERGIARSGRSRETVDIVAFLRTVVGDFEPAAAVIRRELLTYFLAPVYQKVFTADGYGEDTESVASAWASGNRDGILDRISDRTVADHSVLGSVTECRRQAAELVEAGIDRAILFPIAPDGMPSQAAILETVRALAPV